VRDVCVVAQSLFNSAQIEVQLKATTISLGNKDGDCLSTSLPFVVIVLSPPGGRVEALAFQAHPAVPTCRRAEFHRPRRAMLPVVCEHTQHVPTGYVRRPSYTS
jgi:hypothetical protein